MSVRQLSVLHVLGRVTPTGGAEVSIVQMLPRLAAAGLRQRLVTLHAHTDVAAVGRLEAAGVEVVAHEVSHALPAVRAVRRQIADFGPDVVHSTLWEADRAARPAARLAGVPAVTSLVNAPGRDAGMSRSVAAKVQVLRRVDILLARHMTDGFHAITQAAAEHGVREGGVPADRVTVVPRGRDRRGLGEPSPERRARVRAALGIPDDVPLLLNVGRQERQKGQVLLMEAFARVLERRPGVVLLVAGREGAATGPLREAVSRLRLQDSVRLLGPRSDVADLLCAADLFVFSSLWEGLGGAVLEAMALQVPVISFAVPAVEEVLGGHGYLAPVGNADRLADRVQEALADPTTAGEQARRARERFDQHYDLDVVTRQMLAFYDTFRSTGAGGRRG